MLNELTERVRNLVSDKDALGFDIKFNLGDEGVIFVAGSNSPIEVSNTDGDAVTTFNMDGADLGAMLDGELAPMNAFMGGKLKIDGDMAKAMQLSSLFS